MQFAIAFIVVRLHGEFDSIGTERECGHYPAYVAPERGRQSVSAAIGLDATFLMRPSHSDHPKSAQNPECVLQMELKHGALASECFQRALKTSSYALDAFASLALANTPARALKHVMANLVALRKKNFPDATSPLRPV